MSDGKGTEKPLPSDSLAADAASRSGQGSIPVLSRASEEGEKRRKMEIFFIVAGIIVVIIIAGVIASALTDRKSDGAQAQSSQEASPEEFAPVTGEEDVTVSLDGASKDFTLDVEQHELESVLTQASVEKPTTVSELAAATQRQTAAKPSVDMDALLSETTAVTQSAAASSNSVTQVIDSFFNGRYYFDGELISSGERTPFEIAQDGEDFQVFSELEGMDVSVMSLGGKLYLLNPDNKTYAAVNSALKSVMGVSEDEFKIEFSQTQFDGEKPDAVLSAEYNGAPAVCYRYKSSDSHLEFIAVGNTVKQVSVFDSSGKAQTILIADEFSSEIPADMLTFKGYSKTNMISFMKDMM